MLKGWFTGLRVLAYLKRLTIAAESLAQSAETIARISQDEWEAKYAPRPKGKFINGQLDQEEANKMWRKRQEMEGTGLEE
jgi:hypothetical protein